MNIDTREITLEPADNARLLGLCGPFDDNIKQLERRLGIEINRRDNHFKLTGRALCVHAAADILRSLYVDTAPMRGQIQDIEPEQIHLAIKEARVLEQSAEVLIEFLEADLFVCRLRDASGEWINNIDITHALKPLAIALFRPTPQVAAIRAMAIEGACALIAHTEFAAHGRPVRRFALQHRIDIE